MSNSVYNMVRLRLPDTRTPETSAPQQIPRLRTHNLLTSRDESEVRRFLGEKNFIVEFAADDRALLEAHINGVYLAGMYLGYASYGRATALQATSRRTDFWLQLPVQRRFEVETAGEKLLCDWHYGAVLSPALESRVIAESGCARLVLSM